MHYYSYSTKKALNNLQFTLYYFLLKFTKSHKKINLQKLSFF
jgi:hypothetical protein